MKFSYLRIPKLPTMKILFLLPLIVFCRPNNFTNTISSSFQKDTTVVIHVLDGNTAEWPGEKFKTDKETNIEYAVDNDNQTLFLAILISDKTIQKKVMQEGLNLFIDTKGKKKENKGIEFPLRMENSASTESMKLFGFGNGEPFVQAIKAEGTANIAISWDSAFVVHIEYNIPLIMLEKTLGELNNKKISIGWGLKESEVPVVTSQPSQAVATTTTRVVGVPAGSQPSSIRNPPNLNNNVRNVNNNPAPQPNSNKGQAFWTTHTIIF